MTISNKHTRELAEYHRLIIDQEPGRAVIKDQRDGDIVTVLSSPLDSVDCLHCWMRGYASAIAQQQKHQSRHERSQVVTELGNRT